MAQLHLAFPSPVAPVKRQNEWELTDEFQKPYRLAAVIRELDVRKTGADFLIHG
jgi:hypothetical protein